MLQDTLSRIMHANIKKAEEIYSSESTRLALIRAYQAKYAKIPSKADIALVLGTSLGLYPDKFRKRIYTAVRLVEEGRVSHVMFSGKSDHETDDVNQSGDAKNIAVSECGLNEGVILTVGGDNTNENIKAAKEILSHSKQNMRSVYIVSDAPHLLRAMPLVDYVFNATDIDCYPFPILNESDVDPNDPNAIEEMVKSTLYDGLLTRTHEPVDGKIQNRIDHIVSSFTARIRAMPEVRKVSFEEWKRGLKVEYL